MENIKKIEEIQSKIDEITKQIEIIRNNFDETISKKYDAIEGLREEIEQEKAKSYSSKIIAKHCYKYTEETGIFNYIKVLEIYDDRCQTEYIRKRYKNSQLEYYRIFEHEDFYFTKVTDCTFRKVNPCDLVEISEAEFDSEIIF